jgi:hypothetical protein
MRALYLTALLALGVALLLVCRSEDDPEIRAWRDRRDALRAW